MRSPFRIALALAAVLCVAPARALDIDLTDAGCTVGAGNRVRLERVAVAGYVDRYDAEFGWDGAALAFVLAGASVSRASGTSIDLSAATCELAGSKAFVLRGVALPGIAARYWARLAWDSAALGFAVGDYGVETSGGIGKRYLMAFHACTACTDFRQHATFLAESDDGVQWSLPPGFASWPGSVPDVVRRGNTLYAFNPGTVRRYRFETGAWDTAGTPVSITNSDGARVSFVDPSAIIDDDGRIVLVYLDSTGASGDPASCPAGQTSCTKVFGSAVEVAGSDGAAFVAQAGNRVAVTLDKSGGKADSASDPDVFRAPGGYVIYVSRGGNVQAFAASSLHGSYVPVVGLTDGYLHRDNAGGIPAGHYDAGSGKYWTLVHRSGGGVSSILRAVSDTLATSLSSADYSVYLDGAALPALGAGYSLESPGFAVNRPY